MFSRFLQRALLAVHIVRTVTGVGQQAAFAEHGGHIGVVGGAVLHDDVGRALEVSVWTVMFSGSSAMA